ncbi:helix-turn-helix domain-containing protein [Nonomuraea sp. NBC_01738]|uniref:PucR family transcriptional regulator n=1 Tax=Nonomuraea sp. NBC_01738 TaxID=2976003 RepID=UPI002E12E00D|nr:helix-turn-helix domain-containing protein [Nonomuraea sp. NBC_01738]
MKWVTLRELLAFDEGGVLRLLLAPSGQDVRLEGVIIGDEGPERSCAGRIVLATGLTIQEAARRDAAAVVVRGGDVPEDVLSTADEYGIALLARSEWADWDDVATLLRSAIAYAEAGRGDRMADAMEGGGLAALASVVAEFTGGSITIEDTQFRVLAHSATGPEADELRRSTILSGKVPDWRVEELRRSGLLRSLWSSDEVIHRPADGDTPERLIIAIRSGREMLGSIWAAADGRTLTANAASALSRAAEVAVPYLLQHRLRESAARRREEHALRGLLSGDGEMSAHAWSLGLSPDVRCAVVVAEYDGLPGAAAERVMGALALQAASSRGTARVLRESARVVALLPLGDGDERDVLALARELDALAASTQGAGPVWVGAGAVVPTPLLASASRAEAGLVVRVLRERGGLEDGRRHATAGELRPALDVLRVLDAVRPVWEHGSGPIHELVRTDQEAGGELVRSIAAYLEATGDVATAAKRLVLHPNTLRYRLRRARERFGVDLDDPDTRLMMSLVVRLVGRP